MAVVGQAMGHGDVSTDVQRKVWQECYAQLLYLPSQKRFTRASLATKKERIESFEKQLDQKRNQMTEEAKKAANIEKKLKVLLAGYQVIFIIAHSVMFVVKISYLKNIFVYIYLFNLVDSLLLIINIFYYFITSLFLVTCPIFDQVNSREL